MGAEILIVHPLELEEEADMVVISYLLQSMYIASFCLPIERFACSMSTRMFRPCISQFGLCEGAMSHVELSNLGSKPASNMQLKIGVWCLISS